MKSIVFYYQLRQSLYIYLISISFCFFFVHSLCFAQSGMIKVPYLIGLERSVAIQRILDAGLGIETILSRCNNDFPDGRIFRQDPMPDTMVPSGTKLRLEESTGPCAQVPAVVGLTEDLAGRNITNSGLRVNRLDKCSGTVEAGKVIDQYPDAGNTVEPNTTVTIWVSTGGCPVPDLVGKSENQAISELEFYGIKLGRIIRLCSDSYPFGSVFEQDPPPGTVLDKEGAVTIKVSEGNCTPTKEGESNPNIDDNKSDTCGCGGKKMTFKDYMSQILNLALVLATLFTLNAMKGNKREGKRK